MAEKRIFNFSAGPGVLPEQVLKTAADQMLNYKGSGMSVMEMSHRSSVYDTIIKDTEKRLRSLMQIPDNYKVLFLQGGASTQFASVALNLMQKGKADYVVTGYFAKKAAQEAKKFGEVNIAASTEPENFSRIPKQEELKLDADADYVYICNNNTVYGTEWNHVPQTDGVTLVADMSSDILSRPIDVSQYGVIFAGAQKNMGCAGLTVVIIREDLIGPCVRSDADDAGLCADGGKRLDVQYAADLCDLHSRTRPGMGRAAGRPAGDAGAQREESEDAV